jgi:hypothetical protein
VGAGQATADGGVAVGVGVGGGVGLGVGFVDPPPQAAIPNESDKASAAEYFICGALYLGGAGSPCKKV